MGRSARRVREDLCQVVRVMRSIATCPTCARSFTTTPRRFRYCSRACADTRGIRQADCGQCGRSFRPVRRDQFLCSVKCAGAAKKLTPQQREARIQSRIEDLEWMITSGETLDRAAARMGVGTKRLVYWCSQHQRLDLISRLRGNRVKAAA